VDRAKIGYAKIFERLLEDAGTMADQLDEYSALGDWRLFFWERDATAKVTAADVNRVAATYLTRNNRTVGVYYAAQKPERVEVPEVKDAATRMDGYTGRAPVATTKAFDATPENLEARVTRGTMGPIKTAFLAKPTQGDMVSMRLTLRYGNTDALAGRVTAAELLPSMLMSGSKNFTRQQLVDAVNKLGAGIAIGGPVGEMVVSVNAKKSDVPAVLAIVRDVLREPAFPQAEFEKLKAESLAGLAARKTEPGALAGIAVDRKVQPFPKSDVRYKATIEETIAAVKATTLSDVKAIYTDLIGAGTGELTVVGDIDAAVVTRELQPALAGWVSKVEYRRVPNEDFPGVKGETVRIETPDKENAIYTASLTFPMTDTDQDFPAMMLGTYILGGGSIESRLGTKVRKEKGLSYGVGADFSAHSVDRFATFSLFATTNPANMSKAAEAIAAELKAFLADGPSDTELAAAKKGFLEQFRQALAEDAVLVEILSNGLALNRTFARQAGMMQAMEKVTADDVRRAFRRAVDPAKLVIAEAGDFAKAGAVGVRTKK
jgi:zinc protease